MEELFKRIEEAYREALKNEIKANTVLLNENLGLVKEFWLAGANYPKMICGLEVRVTNELPDNVSFAVTRTAQTERDKLITETEKQVAQEFCYRIEQCGMDYGKVMSVLEELGNKYGVEKID